MKLIGQKSWAVILIFLRFTYDVIIYFIWQCKEYFLGNYLDENSQSKQIGLLPWFHILQYFEINIMSFRKEILLRIFAGL